MPIRISNNQNKENTYDDRYVLVAGDTMTGELVIKPASGDDALYVKKQIHVYAGQKVYFDGRPK